MLSGEKQREIIKKMRNRYTVCPEKPYFKAALDAIEGGLDVPFVEAARREVDHFAPLITDPNVNNKIDLFFSLTGMGSKLAKINNKKAVSINNVAVIGAGLMGQGIAQVCADKGMNVVLIDMDESIAKAAKENIGNGLDKLVQKGRWLRKRRDRLMSNIRVTTDYEELKETPLVIEAVFEDLNLKKKILRDVQDVNPHIVFASNTSTMPMKFP